MPRKNTPAADYPQAVLQQIDQLAQNIAIARKRRGESQAQWAGKLGISQPTMARIERGDPSVAMASYVMCMWLINQARGLADVIAPQHDHAALEKEVGKVRTARRSRTPVPPPLSHAGAATEATVARSAAAMARPASAPAGAPHDSMSSARTTALSGPARRPAEPLDEVRKALARTTKRSSTQATPGAASGLAALLAGPDPHKK